MTATLTSSFTSRTLPWMKIGHQIDDPSVTAAEAARLGGIDFDVEVRRAMFEGSEPGRWKHVPTRHALVRSDNDLFFDFVSSEYKVMQYRTAFEFMDGVNPNFVAAGALSGGRQGFMVVQFPGNETFDPMPGGESDPHSLYVVLRTSHDRSKAIEIAVLPLRELCMNQLGLPSLVRGAEQRWSIPHIGDPVAKLRNAKSALTRSLRYVEVFQGMAQQLASVPVTAEVARQVIRRVLPDRPRRDEKIAAIEAAFSSSPYVGFNDSGWGLVNAMSDYLEHGRQGGSRTNQSRFTDGLAGQTAKYVGRTAQLLLSRA